MKKKKIDIGGLNAAFFDIDGTLVSFDTHRVPASAIDALRELKGRGVEIVIATGRGAEPIPEIMDVPYSAIIGLNGTECVSASGDVLFRHSIPECLFGQVLDAGEKYNFAVAAKFSGGFVVDRITPRVEAMAANIASPCPPVGDLRRLFREEDGTGQMCIFTDEKTERDVMEHLPGLSSSRWCPIFADINLAGVDKGMGVVRYLEIRGIRREHTISFGDGGNDIPMLRATGIGVAMGNAGEEVKHEADFVTGHIDRDGLAEALRHFCLHK